MNYGAELAAIALALVFVAVSPGPAFILVTQKSISESLLSGLSTALGITIGSLIWVTLVFLGISVLLQTAAWAYTALKIFGGLYLVYLGGQIWRGASKPFYMASGPLAGSSALKPFFSAIMIQMLNPKAAVFFGSVFITMLSPGAPMWVKITSLGIVFVIEFGWYALMATVFSSKIAQRKYLAAKLYIERIAGVWLVFFGAKLVISEK